MRLDSKLTYSRQIEYATAKAARITNQLSRLMANVGGPLGTRRKLLLEASNSVLLYGSEIWAPTLGTQTRAKRLLSVQRTAALRVTSAYRTVSAPAVLVIAGMVPIDLKAMERREIYIAKRSPDQLQPSVTIQQKTMEKWQRRWREEERGRWTYKLITNILQWANRAGGEVNYYITQMLSGHGYFRYYLHRMGKCSSPFCIYEEEEVLDDAEHTFFSCGRWGESRRELEAEIGAFAPGNIVQKMLSSEASWNAVRRYVEKVLKRKKSDLDAVDIAEISA